MVKKGKAKIIIKLLKISFGVYKLWFLWYNVLV